MLHCGTVAYDEIRGNDGDHDPAGGGVERNQAAAGVDRDHLERSRLKVFVFQIQQDGV